MKQIMIDIETLGTSPYSAIISIGAAQFDIETGEIGRTFLCNIDLQSCFDAGLKADASTIIWWLQQSDHARSKVIDNPGKLLPTLSAFIAFIKDCSEDSEVWANSPSFDLNLLKDAFKLCNLSCPWKFWNERDCRTLVSFTPDIKKSMVNNLPHDALSDCLYQIKYCTAIYNSINVNIETLKNQSNG